MSVEGWHTVLVLGGTRSGKSAFAESLLDDAASVRYIATAVGGEDDPEWLARIEVHQRRRPQSWSTEETGADPEHLAEVLRQAKPDETLLVDDLGGWIAALLDPARQPNDDQATVAALATAAQACRARLVLVSPEVGLSLVAANPVGRAFTDALGTANQALAAVCDRVALVVAGQPVWLKPGTPAPAAPPTSAGAAPAGAAPAPSHDAMTAATPVGPAAAALAAHDARIEAQQAHAAAEQAGAVQAGPGQAGPGQAGPVQAGAEGRDAPRYQPVFGARPQADRDGAGGLPAAGVPGDAAVQPPVDASAVVIEPGMDLPLPDQDAGPDARDRLPTLDLPGTGFGVLVQAVEFAAATQSTVVPRPWTAVRVLLLHGSHAGAASAGADVEEAARRAAQADAGQGALARLAAEAGVDVQVVRAPAAGAMEHGPVLDAETVDEALLHGWHLAARAADDGMDAIVLGSCGAGTEAAAAAVLAATSGAEPVAVLARVLIPGGFLDDASWMLRCAAVRDAMHRIRHSSRGAKDVLAEVAGGDIAVATGVLLGAAARQVPVLLDGPVGIAAGLVARDLATQTRHWCLLVDHGNQPAVRQGADVLGLDPVLSLGLDLGEGANVLAALPLLRAAIGLAGVLPAHPGLPPAHDHEPDDSYVASFDDPDAEPGSADGRTADDAPAPDTQHAADTQHAVDNQDAADTQHAVDNQDAPDTQHAPDIRDAADPGHRRVDAPGA